MLYYYSCTVALWFRYEEANFWCLSTVCAYSHNLPQFLIDRPTFSVLHCLQRLPPAIGDIPHLTMTQSQAAHCCVWHRSVHSEVCRCRAEHLQSQAAQWPQSAVTIMWMCPLDTTQSAMQAFTGSYNEVPGRWWLGWYTWILPVFPSVHLRPWHCSWTQPCWHDCIVFAGQWPRASCGAWHHTSAFRRNSCRSTVFSDSGGSATYAHHICRKTAVATVPSVGSYVHLYICTNGYGLRAAYVGVCNEYMQPSEDHAALRWNHRLVKCSIADTRLHRLSALRLVK